MSTSTPYALFISYHTHHSHILYVISPIPPVVRRAADRAAMGLEPTPRALLRGLTMRAPRTTRPPDPRFVYLIWPDLDLYLV